MRVLVRLARLMRNMNLSQLLHYPAMQELKYHLHPLYWKLKGRKGMWKACEYIPKDIVTIVDAGAADGDYARELLREFFHAQIICFEPIPQSAKECTRKLSQHRPERDFSVHALALSDAKGPTTLRYDPAHPDSGS